MHRSFWVEFVRYVAILIAAAVFIFPFVWMLSQSLKSLGDYYRLPPAIIPAHMRWDNYTKIVNNFPIISAALNSFVVALAVTILQLITASLGGFAFATLRFRGKSIVFVVLLSQLMLPVSVVLVPMFTIVQNLGLVGSLWGMILPFAFTAFGTFLMTQFFRGIPFELFEAARMDGASYFWIWRRVYLPLAPSGLATLGVLVFVYYWNELLWPILISRGSDSQTLPVLLAQMFGMSAASPQLAMAGAAMAVFLPLCLFLFLQRFFVTGITAGSVK